MSQAIIESLKCNLGRTVTIFTTSGGLSGSGFTGVLVEVTPCVVKIITQVGAPPACPIGSACDYGYGGYGYGYGGGCGCGGGGYGSGYGGGYGGGGGFNWLGAIAEIPI